MMARLAPKRRVGALRRRRLPSADDRGRRDESRTARHRGRGRRPGTRSRSRTPVFGVLAPVSGEQRPGTRRRRSRRAVPRRRARWSRSRPICSRSCVLRPPGEIGVDIVVGSAQRFGVPPMFGGPHAGFLAVRDEHKRTLPGRLVGVSVDAAGRPALRLALQTREQHIRREKATSNICTAQVLLAVIAGLYAVYHGPEGLDRIARRVHRLAAILAAGLRDAGVDVVTDAFFDTHHRAGAGRGRGGRRGGAAPAHQPARRRRRHARHHARRDDDRRDRRSRCGPRSASSASVAELDAVVDDAFPAELRRHSEVLAHPIFHRYRSETQMLRYLRRLADRDVALDRSMIPLGSCTMKLNSTTEMLPVTWPEFASLHPFAPLDQAARLPRADRRPRAHARRDHRLRRGVAATERGFAG